MKIYTSRSVWDAALERMRWIFDNFEEVTVNFSGGKDSTCCLHLALQVAEERGALPLNVMWIDQEVEWRNVVEYVRSVMNDQRVKPYWLQVPFRLFNATSHTDQWLECWKEGGPWLRPKEPNSIHENELGTDRFAEMFKGYARRYFPDKSHCCIGGVRADESPARKAGLTNYETFRGKTWGNKEDAKRNHYTMYPIYDWTYRDVWKAIHDNGWPYCKLYDYQYQHGVDVRSMRVSSVHHETAINSLKYMHEVEPDTWAEMVKRTGASNAVAQCPAAYSLPKELPAAFSDWQEYRDYLLENLVTDQEVKEKFKKSFKQQEALWKPVILEKLWKCHVAAVLVNDYHGTKYSSFRTANMKYLKRAGSKKRGA